MTSALDALEALAQKATSGPWAVHENPRYWVELDPKKEHQPCQGDPNRDNNAAYVAALDPQTVLAIIACVRAADGYIENTSGENDDWWEWMKKYRAARAKLEDAK